MFIGNNHASFHLWWKKNLVKHQKVSKYENGCVFFFCKWKFSSFMTCNFFLDVSHNISQNAKFWKDVKKCRNVILFWTGSLCDIKEYIIHIKNYSHSDKNILLLLYNKGLIIFSFLAVNRNQLKKNKNVPESGVWKFSNSLLFNTDFLAKLKIHIILKL